MTPRWLELTTLLTMLGTGLMGGTFFAFSAAVMPALARLPEGQGATAMNIINLVIVRSPFIPVFMGTALACLALGVAAMFFLNRPAGVWLLAGSLLYLAGGIGVTLAVNVPMNDALAAVDPGSTLGTEIWKGYLASWTPWNTVRALSCLLSTTAFAVACLHR